LRPRRTNKFGVHTESPMGARDVHPPNGAQKLHVGNGPQEPEPEMEPQTETGSDMECHARRWKGALVRVRCAHGRRLMVEEWCPEREPEPELGPEPEPETRKRMEWNEVERGTPGDRLRS
jgi:hypothetical protein